MRHRTSLLLLIGLPLSALAACGDDTGSGGGDTTSSSSTGSPTSSSSTSSASSSSTATSSSSSTGGGGNAAFMVPEPFPVPLSAAGPDQLQSVTAGPADGEFYAAGFAAAAVGGPRAVVVVKYGPTGPDMTFGTMGVATTPLVFVGGADEIDIVTQSDGSILVSATIANTANTADRDVAVTRLDATGMVDPDFGDAGVATLNLNDAHDNSGMLVGLDASRSLTVDSNDDIFVHAASRALGNDGMGNPRTDTDFVVAKLTADGDIDMMFGTNGQHRLDIAQANATPRGIKAMADDTLIAGGYANTPDAGDTTQAVLYKLTADGDLDTTFAAPAGYFHEPVLAVQTEIYNFAVHGDNLVTAGYGRNSGDTNDYVSLRFDVETGVRDTTWGGEPNGAVVIDPSGTMLGSNARNAIGLPNGGTIIIGSTGPNNAPEQDAVFVVLDANGELDTNYLTGIHVLPLGNDGNDQFWGGAVSGNYVSLVGYQGGGQMQDATTNDDAYGVLFEIQ